ncbi:MULTISPECIES: IucA/IucC family protein [Dickeya]|uniref:Achromobactin biosynthesis protein AcsA @ Siderophore synthetase superfamily, group B n=1 Tax=Dickeya aquatica TaxID=1401087 RepID=A0A375A990_9GAMM|nr:MULTISPECIES: IucA/IucC family protein [Dickeya]SLM62486.1 Achromobactin biosynthesis protein AcsA @ Siderophore synthetase superfamily, group B [Dickeya aquatica]
MENQAINIPPYSHSHYQLACASVMQDLVDCLLAEHFFGPQPLALYRGDEWLAHYGCTTPFGEPAGDARLWRWCCDEREQCHLVLLLRPGITQRWEKVPQTAVYLWQQGGNDWQALEPESFMNRVFAAQQGGQENAKGQALFLDVLTTSVWQTALSQAHRIDTDALMTRTNADFFQVMEQWASLRDRPYHPTAKAKQGLDVQEYCRYVAEFAAPVALNWVAVAKARLQCGDGISDAASQYPARYLLPPAEQAALQQELVARGIADTHIALPVHPWQFDHILEPQLGEVFRHGDCHRLDFSAARYLPTSSLRSMTPCFASADYLKLPMAVYSLGASRYLPAVKMINGGLSERLLRQARAKDALLEQRLYMCDESKWWAFMPPQATLFDEAPRHLSAMVRTYPAELFDNPDYRLLPMAALGTPLPVSRRHFFDDWLAYRGLSADAHGVETLFAELCRCFFDINFRLFRLGMLGEIHGQNAVLVWKAGEAHGVLLRDHDSLRIHVPTLEQHGMQDPVYRIKQGHANTLYHDRLDDLLFWLQTLGIQVNLRAIIDTLAETYALSAARLWQVMQMEINDAIDRTGFSSDTHAMLKTRLFDVPNWPQKLLITPMIARAGGPGSMPFGKGEVINPFQAIMGKSC